MASLSQTHPIESDDRLGNDTPDETYVHFLAREGRMILRWTVVIFLAITAIVMMTIPLWAIFPAILALIAYGCLILITGLEANTRRKQHRSGFQSHSAVQSAASVKPAAIGGEDEWRLPIPLILKETRIAVEVVLGLVVITTVLAWVAAQSLELFFLTGLILFAYMLFIMAPVWLGWIEKEVQDETWRLKRGG